MAFPDSDSEHTENRAENRTADFPRTGGQLSPGDLWPSGHRSGFVAVVGSPNVGKSTLVNALVEQKVAIVSPKPQTTRHRMLAILTREEAQIVFMDTPGLHKPLHLLGRYMVEGAHGAIAEADAILWLADATHEPTGEDRLVAQALATAGSVPIALLINKVDLVAENRTADSPSDERVLGERQQHYHALLEVAAVLPISATTGKGLDGVLSWLLGILPVGPRYYPEDQVTDREERFLAAELVREQALHFLREEVPHALTVSVDEFKERANGVAYIAATIYVERDSQKGIVIGAAGATLKAISTAARKEMELALDRPVYLELWVKVRRHWRQDQKHLRQLGYATHRRDP